MAARLGSLVLVIGLLAAGCRGRAAPDASPDPLAVTPDAWGALLASEVGRDGLRQAVREAGLVSPVPAWVEARSPGAVGRARADVAAAKVTVEATLALPVPEGDTWSDVVLAWPLLTNASDGRVVLGPCKQEDVAVIPSREGTYLRLPKGAPAGGWAVVTVSAEVILPPAATLAEAPGMDGFGLVADWGEGYLNVHGLLPVLAPRAAGDWLLDPPASLGERAQGPLMDWAVSLTVPTGADVSTSGVELSALGHEARLRYEIAAPLVRAVGLSLAPERARLVRTGRTALVVHAEDAPRASVVGNEAMDALARLTGALGPLPWKELELADVPAYRALGTELEGAAWLHPRTGTADDTVAHEVAHQWFAGVVSTDVRGEPWVDEGLATWLGAWAASQGDARRRAELLGFDSLRTLVAAQPGALAASLPAVAYPSLEAYALAAYGRSAAFFEALARASSDAALLASIRGALDAHAGGVLEGWALREQLAADLGAGVVDEAWSAWMAGEEPVPVAPTVDTQADELAADGDPAEPAPADAVPADEVPADPVPADEVPAEAVPSGAVPADEPPADGVPADADATAAPVPSPPSEPGAVQRLPEPEEGSAPVVLPEPADEEVVDEPL
jgi:hypothetical protein